MFAARAFRKSLLPAFAGLAVLLAAGCSSAPELPKGNSQSLAVGAVLPLSGPDALLGQSLKQGLTLAASDINAAGGVNGKPVALGIIDSQSDSTEGAKALETFRDRDVAILLVAENPLVMEQAEYLADYPQLVAFLCDYVAVPNLTPKNGVRIYLNGDQEGRAIEGYLAAAGVNKVAILHASNLGGESNAKYLEFLIHGDYIGTYKDGYTPTERDFRPLVDAMGRLDTDALVLIGYGPEYANIVDTFGFAGWKGLALAYLGQGSLAGLGNQTGPAANILYPVPAYVLNPRATPAGLAFADKYRALYGQDPDLPAAYAYDNLRVLAAGAARASSNQPQKIREGYLALKSYAGAAGTYAIMPDGDTQMPLQLVTGDGQPAPPPPKPTQPPAMSNIPKPAGGLGSQLTDSLAPPLPAANTTLKPAGNSTVNPGNTTAPTPAGAAP
jgi:branched-chain amino acid transport system substrate-binding protein